MKEVFYSVKENGIEGMRRKCRILEEEGYTILSVEEGQIKQWGSAIPTSPSYGQTESGWIINVQR